MISGADWELKPGAPIAVLSAGVHRDSISIGWLQRNKCQLPLLE
jgi:hypothetical protein